MRSMYKLKWCICSDNRCKTIPNELYENRGSRCKWQCTLFTIFNIVPSFYRTKKNSYVILKIQSISILGAL